MSLRQIRFNFPIDPSEAQSRVSELFGSGEALGQLQGMMSQADGLMGSMRSSMESQVQESLGAATSQVSSLASSMGSARSAIESQLGEFALPMRVTSALSALGRAEDLMKMASSLAGAGPSGLSADVSANVDRVSDAVSQAQEALAQVQSSVAGVSLPGNLNINSIISQATSGLGSAVGSATSSLGGISELASTGGAAMEALESSIGGMSEQIKNLPQNLGIATSFIRMQQESGAMPKTLEAGQAVMQQMFGSVLGQANSIVGDVMGQAQGLAGQLSGGAAGMAGALGSAMGSMSGPAGQLASMIGNEQSLLDNAVSALSQASDSSGIMSLFRNPYAASVLSQVASPEILEIAKQAIMNEAMGVIENNIPSEFLDMVEVIKDWT